MKVTFCLRRDGVQKPGGDTSKAIRLAAELKKLGWDAVVRYGAIDTDTDIVHLVNLDLPLENLAYVERAQHRKLPTVISTVHHPYDGLRAFYRSDLDLFYRRVRRAGLSVDRAVSLREAVKLAAHRELHVRGARSVRSNQTRLASVVELLLPMSEREASALRADLSVDTSMMSVPNGSTFVDESNVRPTSFRWKIITVGRIEPRKNSLALARAAVQLGLPTLFVGAVNQNHREYAESFSKLVASATCIEHLSEVPNARIPDLLRASEIYLNPAWFEVVSQADIEAATIGLCIATTKFSYVEDFIGPHCKLDPERMNSDGVAELKRCMDEAHPCPVVSRATWHSAAGMLRDAYMRVLSN